VPELVLVALLFLEFSAAKECRVKEYFYHIVAIEKCVCNWDSILNKYVVCLKNLFSIQGDGGERVQAFKDQVYV